MLLCLFHDPSGVDCRDTSHITFACEGNFMEDNALGSSGSK